MRIRLPAAGAAVAFSLVLPPAAWAHGSLSPASATAGSTQAFELTVPNDRGDADIVGVALQLPDGVELESAQARQPLWTVFSGGGVVTWQGGPIERGSVETFSFEARLPTGPDSLEFQLVETYDDGRAPPFPIEVTLAAAAGAEGGSDALALAALLVAIAAALLAATALVVALRRPEKPPPPA